MSVEPWQAAAAGCIIGGLTLIGTIPGGVTATDWVVIVIATLTGFAAFGVYMNYRNTREVEDRLVRLGTQVDRLRIQLALRDETEDD